MALIMCECGHADYDHHKGKCYGINELPGGRLEHCKCTSAKWRNLFEKLEEALWLFMWSRRKVTAFSSSS